MNELETLLEAIKSLTNIDEENLSDEALNTILNNLKENFSSALVNQSINQIIKNLDEQGLDKKEARAAIDALNETLKELVYGEENYTGNKKIIVDTILSNMSDIFNTAVEKYHSYSIELPMKLEEGAFVPTYAHETDACADLYALENVKLNPESYGNKISTGVSIQLPEGWLAMIFPRSSTGAKTTLRLSNSVGIIDSGYRGELGVLFDNTSQSLMTLIVA